MLHKILTSLLPSKLYVIIQKDKCQKKNHQNATNDNLQEVPLHLRGMNLALTTPK